MSKLNIIDFIKSIFTAQGIKKNERNLERGAMPNPFVVGFIFTVLFIIPIIFIVLEF